ncbi:K+dependent Na+ exchanger related-protein [Hoeflea sp. IMCC20628]|uniref:calcium/sodium antiporter n=1 Tax=Hoeflea sp. IMCC20628 TaxID=1620421 RepID=UPI00063AA7F0|nr:calcium/sodium antiporter [Hoeflea sp. IMCC20628]AKI01128.1 K+dependent Na+ exchanger related-protein [Hoeflea sp. IMCC20628]
MLSILTLIAGLVVLVFAGDYLVRGAVALAEKLSIDPLIIGLTIVAFGTSAPEMFVSLQAAFDGVSGIAVGNVVGSNIANVLLVLGGPALLMSISCREKGIGMSLAVMIFMTLTLMVMMWFGPLSRLDGAILLIMMGSYLGWQIKAARECGMGPASDYHSEVADVPQENWKTGAFILGGLIGLPIGAWLTVNGASHIARMLGASETVIGLTIVAIGTSLPELVTSVMAAWRKSGAVAIGNVVGSNIFNIGLILGGTSVILPLEVDPRITSIDMWVMLAAGLLVVGLAHWNIAIKKLGGVAMLLVFAAYIFSVF